jgi:hypothetical protein
MYIHLGLWVVNFIQVHMAFIFLPFKKETYFFCHTRYVLVNGSLARSLSPLFGRTAFGSPLSIGFTSSCTYRPYTVVLFTCLILFCVHVFNLEICHLRDCHIA